MDSSYCSSLSLKEETWFHSVGLHLRRFTLCYFIIYLGIFFISFRICVQNCDLMIFRKTLYYNGDTTKFGTYCHAYCQSTKHMPPSRKKYHPLLLQVVTPMFKTLEISYENLSESRFSELFLLKLSKTSLSQGIAHTWISSENLSKVRFSKKN